MSLKKGELVDFEAHLVGRSRNAAKPRVKRGRKSTLTADRMEKLLGCVRRGLSNKDACMVAGISETTFYRWIEKGKHAKRGVLALFTVGDVSASLCKRGAYAPFSAQRRSRALFWL